MKPTHPYILDALDLDALDFDDYKTELLSSHDLQLHLTRKILFGHDVETNIYNFQFEEFESKEIDSILSKIGEFHQSDPSKCECVMPQRVASKRVNAQPQGSSLAKRPKTDDNSTAQALKDVTNLTDKNVTDGVNNDDETRVITKEKPINISKASSDRSITDSSLGTSLAQSLLAPSLD